MHTCPHCGEATIPAWRKSGATSLRPARCGRCGGLSYVSGWTHALASLLAEVALWGGIALAVALQRWAGLLVSILGLAAVVYLVTARSKLVAVAPEAVRKARARFVLEMLVAAAIVWGLYLAFGPGQGSG